MFFIWLKPSLNALHFSCYEFCLKVQESRDKKRVFLLEEGCTEVEEEVVWAGPGFIFFSHPIFMFTPP